MKNSSLQSTDFSATDALRTAVMALQKAYIETASLDARLLLEHCLNVSREQLLADGSLTLTPQQHEHYQVLISRRAAHQPVSQLVERREFWGLAFKVTPDVLDPRPDSETLIEAVKVHFPDTQAALTILDLGTGSGCLLLTLLNEYKNARGTGVDISNEALTIARENAMKLGLQARAVFAQGVWGTDIEGAFDAVICNPPYIPSGDIAALAPEVALYEPKLALDGGKDGLDCYRAVMPQLPGLLKENGLAVFEIGMGQHTEVAALANAQEALRTAGIKEDMSGIARCVLVKRQSL